MTIDFLLRMLNLSEISMMFIFPFLEEGLCILFPHPGEAYRGTVMTMSLQEPQLLEQETAEASCH